MSELIVSGDLPTILTKLNRIMAVVKDREATGWPLLQADEEWIYYTKGDERVCPICQGLEAEATFRGDTIPERFPYYNIQMAQVKPNVHFHPDCRCWMEMIDPAGTMEARLHLEKQLAGGE